MRVLHHPVSSAVAFLLRTFNATADAATALCKQIETTSIFFRTPEANLTNQSCDYVQPMAAALRNVAVGS